MNSSNTVEQRHKPPSRRTPSRLRLVGLAVLSVVTAYSILRVNLLPIIVPDSLMYLEHSNDLAGTGLVQVGFRQFGYPLWLASTDAFARLVHLEPLAVTVIAQRILLVVSIGLSVRVLRWWSTPIVFVLLLPSTVAYSNFILTEAIAIPIVVLASVSCVALFQESNPRASIMWMTSASIGAAVLPMIRLHYGLLTVAIIATVIAKAASQATIRRAAVVAVGAIVVSTSVLVLALSVENRIENDQFFPSLGSERVLFWASWETVVTQHRSTVARELPEIYLDGTPDAFILVTDNSGMTFRDQSAAYQTATDRIYEVTAESLTVQRVESLIGVLSGSRIDDLGPVLTDAAMPSSLEGSDRTIHQYGAVAVVDSDWIAEEYNGGKTPHAVIAAAASLPNITLPYVGIVMANLLVVAIAAGIYLTVTQASRQLAATGLAVLGAYAITSSFYVMDNFRYLFPAYLFSIVVISGAASMRWGKHEIDA